VSACTANPGSNVLVHCHAGVSRSTAAAADPDVPARRRAQEESGVPEAARACASTAGPITRMVEFADTLLKR